MTDIETIYQKCKTAYYRGWNDEDIQACKEILPKLSLEHLRMLNQSRWMNKKSPLYPTLFSLLYKEQLEDVVNKLNEMTNDELLAELKETKSSYRKEQIPHILYQRYDDMNDEERTKVYPLLVRKRLIDKSEGGNDKN